MDARPRERRGVPALAGAFVVLVMWLLAFAPSANATSSITLDTTGCPTATARTVAMPATLPASAVTAADCSFSFMSTTASGMLATYQTDNEDTAMFSDEATSSLDSGYATAGQWTANIANRWDRPVKSFFDDGWIYVIGNTDTGRDHYAYVARFCTATVKVAPCTGPAADGLIDTTWGTAGVASYKSPEGSFDVTGGGIDSLNRIYVSGWIWNWGNGNDTFVLRFTTTGTLDTSWDTDGSLLVDLYGNNDTARTLTVQSDDKVLIGGSTSNEEYAFVLRLTTAGVLDPTFGTGGWFADNPNVSQQDYVSSIVVDGTGNIYAGGTVSTGSFITDFRVTKLTSAGAPAAWGVSGSRTVNLGTRDELVGIALDSSSRIVLGGRSTMASGWDIAAARLTVAGALDTTFASPNGYVTKDGGGGCPWFCNEEAWTFALDSSNRPVLAGQTDRDGVTRATFVARFTAAGVADAAFGTGGMVSGDAGDAGKRSEASALVVDAAGKPTVFAWALSRTTHQAYVVALRRYTAAGVLDPTLNGSRHTIPYPMFATTGDDYAVDTVLQADGRAIVLSRAYDGPDGVFASVSRLSTSGVLDTSFGTSGYARVWPMTPKSVARDSAGNIYVCGHDDPSMFNSQIKIVKLTSAGVVDAAWGPNGNGSATYNPSGNDWEHCDDLHFQADGKLIVVGIARPAGEHDAFIMRLTTTGLLDTTYNAAGAVPGTNTIDFGSGQSTVSSVDLDPSGKAVIFGDLNGDVHVARVTTTGVLDTTFSTDGKVNWRIGGSNTYGKSGIITSTGAIYVSFEFNWFWGESDGRVAKIDTATGLPITTWGGDGSGAGPSYGYWGHQGVFAIDLDPDGNPLIATSLDTGANRSSTISRFSGTSGQNTMLFLTDRSVGLLDEPYALSAQSDGKVLFAGGRTVDTDMNTFVARTDHVEIADYQAGVADWTTGNDMFGMCLRAETGPAVAGTSDTWALGTCTVGGTGWRAVPKGTGAALGTKVLECTVGCASVATTVSFRFGMKAGLTTAPGDYRAPITFTAYDPNVDF